MVVMVQVLGASDAQAHSKYEWRRKLQTTVTVELKQGEEYYFCACGRSKNQPFCDGSHTGTKFTPLPFTAEKETNYMCMCKQSKNPPFCDGTHWYVDFDENK